MRRRVSLVAQLAELFCAGRAQSVFRLGAGLEPGQSIAKSIPPERSGAVFMSPGGYRTTGRKRGETFRVSECASRFLPSTKHCQKCSLSPSPPVLHHVNALQVVSAAQVRK